MCYNPPYLHLPNTRGKMEHYMMLLKPPKKIPAFHLFIFICSKCGGATFHVDTLLANNKYENNIKINRPT